MIDWEEWYKEPTRLGKILKTILELRLRYFIQSNGIVVTYWRGGWVPYHEVMLVDSRMELLYEN